MHISVSSVLFILSIGLISCTSNAGKSSESKDKITGVSFAASKVLIDSVDLVSVKHVGAQWITLMPYGFIREGTTEITYNSNWQWVGETSEGIIKDIKMCRSQGLKIMLKPHVWITHGEYTGDFKLESETDWNSFEESYRKYVLEFAAIAEEQQVEIFCMGTEWRKFISRRPDFWKRLIQEIREVYTGEITYAANWDEYQEIPFWNALDYIGVNAYFSLSETKAPSKEALKLAWQPILNSLAQMSNKIQSPILFTEYGYRSIDGTTIRPWESYTDRNTSLEEQEVAYVALYESVWEQEWFAGGFLWKWFNKHNERGGKDNSDYTPQNKPAEMVVRKYYDIEK